MKRSPILNTAGLYIIETDECPGNGHLPGIDAPEIDDIAVRRMDGQLFIYTEDLGWDLMSSSELRVVIGWFRDNNHPILPAIEEHYAYLWNGHP